MPVVNEIFVEQTGAVDARGNGTHQRRFHVQHDRGSDPLQEVGVPRPYEALVPGSRFRVDRLEAEALNDSPVADSIVTATYSTDGRFTLPPPPPAPDSPEWLGIGWETQDDEIQIPCFKAVPRSHQAVDPVGGPYIAQGIEWVPDHYSARISYLAIERQVVVPVGSRAEVQALITTLKARHDKYHFFDATFWRFQVRSWRQDTPTTYRINYLWTSDPGTPAIGGSTAGRIRPEIERPPFWQYIVVPSPAPTPSDPFPPPTIDVEPRDGVGMNDFDGWIGLPGDPLQ